MDGTATCKHLQRLKQQCSHSTRFPLVVVGIFCQRFSEWWAWSSESWGCASCQASEATTLVRKWSKDTSTSSSIATKGTPTCKNTQNIQNVETSAFWTHNKGILLQIKTISAGVLQIASILFSISQLSRKQERLLRTTRLQTQCQLMDNAWLFVTLLMDLVVLIHVIRFLVVWKTGIVASTTRDMFQILCQFFIMFWKKFRTRWRRFCDCWRRLPKPRRLTKCRTAHSCGLPKAPGWG